MLVDRTSGFQASGDKCAATHSTRYQALGLKFGVGIDYGDPVDPQLFSQYSAGGQTGVGTQLSPFDLAAQLIGDLQI